MRCHARVIQAIQWGIVAGYALLVTLPAFMSLPPDDARFYNNLTIAAQWLFWGLWWPLVIASMLVVGRAWCGVFCPEGTLTEAASRIGLGRAVPRWLQWKGWPFIAFALTTIFGQLVSVYQYATATLLVLGGSTLAAIAVGFVYGRGKRVWCRHLCPVNGVFAVLARLAPLHFKVDTRAWAANAGRQPPRPINCAPLVRIRRMQGPGECHMCGRCSGHQNAIALRSRSPNIEIVALDPARTDGWESALLVFGMIGLSLGAFSWAGSPWFVTLRTSIANWAIEHDWSLLLSDNAPWWLLTHYPQANDVFTWLDGALIVAFITGYAGLVGTWIFSWLACAVRGLSGSWRENVYALSFSLTPLAAAGLVAGLAGVTASLAHGEGWQQQWLPYLRTVLLVGGALWSLRLGYQQFAARAKLTGRALGTWRMGALGFAMSGVLLAWSPLIAHAR